MIADMDLYCELSKTLDKNGFSDCPRILVDNTESNRMDAFQGVNYFLSEAETDYIVLIHDDCHLLHDDIHTLSRCLSDLERRDPKWAVAGNAGADNKGVYQRISMPHIQNDGLQWNYPMKVDTVDENFVVVKRSANLAVSRDLHGFHLWAADLCMVAKMLGWRSYMINFHLWHGVPERADKIGTSAEKRDGTSYPSLADQVLLFQSKWSWLTFPRRWNTTCVQMQLG